MSEYLNYVGAQAPVEETKVEEKPVAKKAAPAPKE